MLEVDKNNSELENYGVWVKSGPENYTDNTKSASSDEFELTDLDNNSDNFLLTEEEERLLDSLEEDVKNSEEDDLFNVQEIDDLSFEEEFSESSDASSREEEFIDIEIPQSIEADEAVKKSSGKQSLKKTLTDSDEIPGLKEDKSYEMLSQIAADLKNDLSTIKNELHELKKELAKYKKLEIEEVSAEETDETPEAAGSGFFSDDGDETIALTGDELDNIFNTAEITEESVTFEEGEKPDEDLDLSSAALPVEESVSEEIEIPSGGFSEEEISTQDSIIAEEETEISLDDVSEPVYAESVEEQAFLDGSLPDEITEEDLEIDSGSESVNIEDEEITLDSIDLAAPEQESSISADEDIFVEEEISLDTESLSEEEITVPDDITLDEEIVLDETFPEPAENEISSETKQAPFSTKKPAPSEEDFTIDEGEEEITLDDSVFSESPEIPDISLDGSEDLVIEEDISFEEPETGEPSPEEASVEDDLSLDIEEPVSVPESFPEEEEINFDIPVEDETADEIEESFTEPVPSLSAPKPSRSEESGEIPDNIKTEIKSVLVYLDQLLEALPDRKIEEFAKSEHFKTYKKLFEELGLM